MYKDFLQYSNTLNVLFIENNDNVRKEFSDILTLFFNKVDVASDGLVGLHLFREHYLDSDRYYDIVITEINSPVIGIEQLIKEMKLINKNQAFVITLDCNESEEVIKLRKLGMKDFLEKSSSAMELQKSLYQLSKDLSSSEISTSNYSQLPDKEVEGINKSLELLRYDDSICLSKLI